MEPDQKKWQWQYWEDEKSGVEWNPDPDNDEEGQWWENQEGGQWENQEGQGENQEGEWKEEMEEAGESQAEEDQTMEPEPVTQPEAMEEEESWGPWTMKATATVATGTPVLAAGTMATGTMGTMAATGTMAAGATGWVDDAWNYGRSSGCNSGCNYWPSWSQWDEWSEAEESGYGNEF